MGLLNFAVGGALAGIGKGITEVGKTQLNVTLKQEQDKADKAYEKSMAEFKQKQSEKTATTADTRKVKAASVKSTDEQKAADVAYDRSIEMEGLKQKGRVKVLDGGGRDKVKSSKILDSGVTQIVRDSGKIEIIEPTPEEAEIIRKAEERGVDLQQRRAQGRVLGADAAKIANKAFTQTEKIRINNRTLRKVISEVRGGADTGPLAAKLPSFRAATVRLNTLRNQLGLDVVGSVTFGALSEGELNLAMSTALPTSLQGPELIKWAEDKISAQEKLATYLEDQAIFLSERGNTHADWLIHIKKNAKQKAQPKQDAAEELSPEEMEELKQLRLKHSQ